MLVCSSAQPGGHGGCGGGVDGYRAVLCRSTQPTSRAGHALPGERQRPTAGSEALREDQRQRVVVSCVDELLFLEANRELMAAKLGAFPPNAVIVHLAETHAKTLPQLASFKTASPR